MSKDQDPRNSEYWEKRIANETWRIYNSIEEQNADLLEMYDRADKSIRSELYVLMEKAQSQDLTRSEAYKKAHLKGLQKKIEKECERLGDQIEEKAVDRMTEAGQEVRKNVMKSLGVEDFDLLPKKTMEQMLRQPWHGSFFQERLWGDTGKLVKSLDDILANGITQGKTATEMAVQLSNTMQSSFNVAHRLVRTETINTLNRSAIRSYKDAGIKKVQWWAAEDERTCPECGKHHGTAYEIGKEPNLPAHPGCRCTWIPVLNEAQIKNLDMPGFAKKQNLDVDSFGDPKLVSYAKDKLQITKVDLDGIDYEIAKNILNAVADVYNQFPAAIGCIKAIEKTSEPNASLGFAPINGNYGAFTLFLNKTFLSDKKNLERQIKKTVALGTYAKGTTIKTTPYHEMGHLLEGLYINKNYPKKIQKLAWDDYLAADEILKKASLACYNKVDYSEAVKAISLYTEYTPSEGLAESVHLELTGRGNAFTKEVLSLLEKGI